MGNRKSIFIILILSLVFITGCSNDRIKAKKLHVSNYNLLVDYILKQYDINITKSKDVEDLVIGGIFGEKIVANDISSICASEIKTVFQEVNQDIERVVDYNLEQEIAAQTMGVSELLIDEVKLKESIITDLEGSLDCFYLIDSTKGILEQTFIFSHINGNHGVFSLYWLEGICFDVGYKVTGGVN